MLSDLCLKLFNQLVVLPSLVDNLNDQEKVSRIVAPHAIRVVMFSRIAFTHEELIKDVSSLMREAFDQPLTEESQKIISSACEKAYKAWYDLIYDDICEPECSYCKEYKEFLFSKKRRNYG